MRGFVFVFVLGASPHNPLPFVAAKGETEKLLRGTDMNWTILAPDAFMDVWVPVVVGGPARGGSRSSWWAREPPTLHDRGAGRRRLHGGVSGPPRRRTGDDPAGRARGRLMAGMSCAPSKKPWAAR